MMDGADDPDYSYDNVMARHTRQSQRRGSCQKRGRKAIL